MQPLSRAPPDRTTGRPARPAPASLDALAAAGVLSPLDAHFARAMARLAGEARPEVLLAAALASRQVARGDVCLDLRSVVSAASTADGPAGLGSAGDPVPDPAPADEEEDPRTILGCYRWPPLDEWLAAVASSALVDPAGGPPREDRAGPGPAPLVLDPRGRLYLRRFWSDEQRVAEAVLARAGSGCAPSLAIGPADVVAERIGRLVAGEARPGELHWPRVAAALALCRSLVVVCGGPGTGKTSAAAALLAVRVEVELSAGRPAPRIALLAPTGKAAARLGQAIASVRAGLRCSEAVRGAIPDAASTVHRALGARPGGRFLRDASSPLAADIVLVDEVSMVDLELMARLVEALSPSTQLLLLGDPEQLASVAAGSVLGDLCGDPHGGAARVGYEPALAGTLQAWSGEAVPRRAGAGPADAAAGAEPLRDCIVRLTHSHRYPEASGIGALAQAVNAGDAARALAVLDDDSCPDVARVDPAPPGRLSEALADALLAGYGPMLRAASAREQLAQLERFRILCALRGGPYGVVRTNQLADELLVRAGLLSTPPRAVPASGAWPGRPLLVTRNALHQGLYNGDVGVVAADGRVAFPAAGGVPGSGGEPRRLQLQQLPACEPVFAMSVHKSQGSEFDEVAVLLPAHPSPLLTRELLYTALTRARARVVVHASERVLAFAVERRVERASGLRDALWGGAS